MPAEVESMFFVGETPWHGAGTRVTDAITSEEAIRAAGLAWEVGIAPLQTPALQLPDGRTVGPIVAEDSRAVIRMTDGRFLGTVGSQYHPIQNESAFAAFDPFVRKGWLRYHTAGSLYDGRKTWIMAELPGEMILPGVRPGARDAVRRYMLLSNAHDGSSALRVLPTPVRVVCANTLRAALGDLDATFTVRHTASADARIDDALHAFEATLRFYQGFQAEAEALAAAPWQLGQQRALAEALFPAKAEAKDGGPRPAVVRARDRIVELFEVGKGHGAIEGTAWAAINAVAEYADHDRPVRASKLLPEAQIRPAAAWFGPAADLKRRAYAYVRATIRGEAVAA